MKDTPVPDNPITTDGNDRLIIDRRRNTNRRSERIAEIWLWGLSIIAIAALFAASLSLIRLDDEQEVRERDRVAFDVETCQHDNELRLKIKALGQANIQLFAEVAGEFAEDQQELLRIQERLATPLRNYQSNVDQIELVDCESLRQLHP